MSNQLYRFKGVTDGTDIPSIRLEDFVSFRKSIDVDDPCVLL